MNTIHSFINYFKELFGEGQELTPEQMSIRAISIFILTVALLRIAGSRSFGIKMPFDTVIYILLGSMLSRAIAGASPFFSTLCAAFAIVILHRVFAWICLYSDSFGKLIKGNSKILFDDGKINHHNMKICAVSEKDLMEAIRQNGGKDSFDEIDQAHMERNGQISIIPKK
jgi:uncharacterized membrane protein YcaP (DUF421 family)